MRTTRRFNEAGADAPEIPRIRQAQIATVAEASMRPGRMPRKYNRSSCTPVNLCWRASMRPGRMPRKYEQVD